MAWATKYRVSFYDHWGSQCIVNIKYDGYSGSVTDLIGKGIPVTHLNPSTGNTIIEWIKGQALEVEFYNITFDQYTQDFTNYGFKNILCEYTRGGNPVFYGFYKPDHCEEPYLDGPHPIKIVFTDGLGLLKNEPFMNGDIIYYGAKTLMQVIYICLKKTGLTEVIDLKEGCNIYRNGNTEGDTYSPLDLNYVWAEHFIVDNEEISCYEVLERILISQAARIEQSGGDWVISPIDSIKSSYVVRRYTDNGTAWAYASYETWDKSITLSNATVSDANKNVFLNHSQFKKIHRSYKSFSIRQNLQKRDALNFTSDFKYFDGNTPIGWGTYYNYNGFGEANTYTNGVKMLNWPMETAFDRFNRLLINVETNGFELDGLKLDFDLKVKIRGWIPDCEIYWNVVLYSGSLNRYIKLDNDGTWDVITSSFYTYRNVYNYTNTETHNSVNTVTISVTSDKIPNDSYDAKPIIILYAPKGYAGSYGYYESISLSVADVYDNIIHERLKTISLNSNNLDTEEVELKIGSLPGYTFDYLVYWNGIGDLDMDNADYNWRKRGDTDYKPLHEILCEILSTYYNRNIWELSGELLGHFVPASRVIDNIINKIFLITEFNEDVKHCQYFVNLIEIDQTEAYLLIEDGDIFEAEDSEYIELN